MTPASSATAYRAWLADRKVGPATLTIPRLVDETLKFYETARCSGLASGSRADMLLYQWGVYDWGHGEHFEFDITRQFIERGKVDDEGISQLRVTAYFAVTDDLRSIKPGNRWCEGVADVKGLSEFIEASPAYRAVYQKAPKQVAIEWSHV